MSIAKWSSEDSYHTVPNNWHVVIADIEDSTKAINEGRYKEVNIVGAACIISVTNEIGSQFTHSVFGGDGATFLVAPEHLNRVESVLSSLSDLATNTFKLKLRVGSVVVAELRNLGSDVRMAKIPMNAGFKLSLFTGGGVTLADQLVKQYPERYLTKLTGKKALKVEGLECRWNDVPSQKGKIMTLLVRPCSGKLDELENVILAIDKLLPNSQPVRKSNLPLTYPPEHLWREMKIRVKNPVLRYLNYVGVLMMTGLMSSFIKRDAFNLKTRVGKYCLSVLDNTDYVKLDDTFRAVLDISIEDAKTLEEFLEVKKKLNLLDYGIHYSNSALMTCFVKSLSNHMHFIDGSDGGYAAASHHLT